jgi:hypothetical protein
MMLETGLGDRDTFNRHVREVAGIFGFQTQIVPCTMARIEAAYTTAKGYLAEE